MAGQILKLTRSEHQLRIRADRETHRATSFLELSTQVPRVFKLLYDSTVNAQ